MFITNKFYMKLASMIFLTLAMLTNVDNVQAQESPSPFRMEIVAEGLDHPWGMAFLPNGSILVTERKGMLRIIRNGVLDSMPIANTPKTYAHSQGGYFDIILHPDFVENQIVYLSFAAGDRKENTTRIVRAQFDGRSLLNVETVFETVPGKDTPVHYGGRMVFLPDGTLLMTTGDGFDYREKAQRKDTTLGKTIRINTDGSIPDDNPFVGVEAAEPEIWTYGHRSPQGLARDPVTGTLYQHEHGPRGGDEVNILTPGGNYGWPIATYGLDYSGATISPFTSYKDTIQPIIHWTPSIAPSGLAVYRGNKFPDWNGDLLVGALAERTLHHLVIDNGKLVEDRVYLKKFGAR